MQFRLTAIATKSNRRGILPFYVTNNQSLLQRFSSAPTTGRPGDPAVHAVEPEEVYPAEAAFDETLRRQRGKEAPKGTNETYAPPKSPTDSAPKLETTGVNERVDPITQHKRRYSSSSNPSGGGVTPVDDLNCAGLDGSPWPEDRMEQRREQMEDDRKYFKDHKASPLSEIEIADTRKPITRATDGTAQNYTVGSDGVVTWLPEQIDSAEDSLRRASEIFRQNAMRGDPDSPHGRILRVLRGEYW